MSSTPVSTWDFLVSIGFANDPDVMSDHKPGLSYSFGGFKLSAVHCFNLHFCEVVVLGGVLSYRSSLAMIDNEMATELESPEQGMAWLSWTLDRAAGGEFHPPNEPAWLEIGRQHQYLLPWIRKRAEMMAAYEARPRCTVSRDWLRQGLKALLKCLEAVADDTLVSFRFQDGVLRIECDGHVIPLPGEAKNWHSPYVIRASKIRRLPKRLMHAVIEISVRDGGLQIGNWYYSGAEPIPQT